MERFWKRLEERGEKEMIGTKEVANRSAVQLLSKLTVGDEYYFYGHKISKKTYKSIEWNLNKILNYTDKEAKKK